MKEIKVVIGKNFGDEGKGRVTDLLCAQLKEEGKRTLVIRHNGGAQAGHTVEDGSFRFVFHQLGSGSLRGAPTYWSETFLPDLLKLGEEIKGFNKTAGFALRGEKVQKVYASQRCRLVTVYDVLLNSCAESLRGVNRHGSCGMGIYETVLRCQGDREKSFSLCLGDLIGKSPGEIAGLLKRVRDEYVPERLARIFNRPISIKACADLAGGSEREEETARWLGLIGNDNLLYHAADLVWENFNKYIVLTEPQELFRLFDVILFENAQGMLLDEDNVSYYPHLTPSHTGLFNVSRLFGRLQSEGQQKSEEWESTVTVHYVTRTYVTRHGPGRLDHECSQKDINPAMRDRTNTPNPWQGELRFARHPEKQEFFAPLWEDAAAFAKSMKTKNFRVFLDVTHLDETGGKILFCSQDMTRAEFQALCEKEERAGICQLTPVFL